MWPRMRLAGFVLLLLTIATLIGGCQLVDQISPSPVQPANRSAPAGGEPDTIDQSPRIRDPQDVPPTWTPGATVRSETPIAPESAATVPAGGQASYTVQAGDTLAEIAVRYNVTLEALAAANGIEDFDHIEAGQVLVIPR